MASYSQNISENLIGKEQANKKNDGAGSNTVMEQSPFTIFLIKNSPKKTLGHEMDSTDQDDLSFKLPKSCLQDLFAMVEVGSTKNIFWSKPINFKIPDDCLDYILAKDEVEIYTQEGEVADGMGRIPLQERLVGWQIEKRQRGTTAQYDKYFYHKKSGRRFRSFVEVEAFIVHARVPKAIKPKERNMPLEPLVSESSKRKRKAHEVREITEEEKKFVEKFLEEAWNNIGKQWVEDEEQVMMEEILRFEMDKQTKNPNGDDELMIQDDR